MGAVPGAARPHVRERVRIRVEELHHVVAVVGDLRDVQDERRVGQVEVTHRVERVDVRLHEHLAARFGRVQLSVRAELVDRGVGKAVRHGDARLRRGLMFELHQRDPIHPGVGADLTRIVGADAAQRRVLEQGARAALLGDRRRERDGVTAVSGRGGRCGGRPGGRRGRRCGGRPGGDRRRSGHDGERSGCRNGKPTLDQIAD